MADAPYDLNAITEYIRKAAIARGIDPEIALKVARSEGLQPGTWQSNVVGPGGIREPSYGPFQLYDKGLGEQFRKKYGKSASDPSTVTQQVDFALDVARAGGWSPWHGWKGDPRAGMGGRPPGEVAVAGPQGAADAAGPTTSAQAAATTPTPSADTPVQGASGEDIPAALLEGKQEKTSLGGLMGAMGGGGASPMSVPDLLPRGGGAQGTPLSEYIQQYIATRLRGQQKPPGPGGQGLG